MQLEVLLCISGALEGKFKGVILQPIRQYPGLPKIVLVWYITGLILWWYFAFLCLWFCNLQVYWYVIVMFSLFGLLPTIFCCGISGGIWLAGWKYSSKIVIFVPFSGRLINLLKQNPYEPSISCRVGHLLLLTCHFSSSSKDKLRVSPGNWPIFPWTLVQSKMTSSRKDPHFST